MPVIAIAVGAIGSAIGTAIGTAIGGTILGVSAATIGGVIGAGLAGGIMSAVNGGSFGKGFLMGAVGSAVGSFLKGGLGDTFSQGATIGPDGTTSADIFASQGGADFAPDALSGTGDISSAVSGMGDISSGGAETFGLGDMGAPQGTALPDTSGTGPQDMTGGNLDWTGGMTPDQMNNLSEEGLMGLTRANAGASMDNAFNPVSTGDSYGSFGAPSQSSGGLQDVFNGQQTPTSPTSLENIGTTTSSSTGTTPAGPQIDNVAPAQTTSATTTQPSSFSLGDSIKGMAKTSDDWLKNTFGLPQGSTARLALGGLDTISKMREVNKLQSMNDSMNTPMSYESYVNDRMDPNAFRTAANQLAASGRTGALPLLLARMKNSGRADYQRYVDELNNRRMTNQQNISGARVSALSNLFNPLAYGMGRGY